MKKPDVSEQSIAYDSTDITNDFYDNEPTHILSLNKIIVTGETSQEFDIDLNALPLHSVIVKETALTPNSNKFIGAYRYDGPSLYDILNHCPLVKKNADQFPPIIDAYVEVENQQGEKVIFSWGEIFYPIHRHEIIIATQVMHIVPSKSKEYWPLPNEARIVAAADLLTERNISSPQKIRIRSLSRDFNVNRDLDPLFAEKITVYKNDETLFEINEYPSDQVLNYPNIFYGRGRGIHAVTPFKGVALKNLLKPYFETTVHVLRRGVFTIKAADGYRCAFTFSEIMNRNDQSEVLLVETGATEGGRYRIYPAADFFSDRSVKAVEEIYLDEF